MSATVIPFPSPRFDRERFIPDADSLFRFTVDWTGRFPGDIEGCSGCGRGLVVRPGQVRWGAIIQHLEPDLFCDECVALAFSPEPVA